MQKCSYQFQIKSWWKQSKTKLIKDTTLYHKTQLKINDWKVGYQLVGRLNNNRALLKKDLVVGYEHGDVSVYLQGNQAWDKPTNDFNNWKQFFSTFSLTTIYRRGLR